MPISWTAVFNRLQDPYDVKARLFPGLLVLLPAILYLALILGPKNPTVAGLSTIFAACGGPYLLASLVRTWGLRAQERLYRQWGAQPTTIVFRHRDTAMAHQTKMRYHELARLRLDIEMPTSDEEQLDPVAADRAYAAAADRLRPLTTDRKAFPFVFKELIAYGFNRNAHGSRWVGVVVAASTIGATLSSASESNFQSPTNILAALGPAQMVVLLSAIAMLGLWCGHFTDQTVKIAGFSYAKRLWEALDLLPRRSRRPRLRSSESTT